VIPTGRKAPSARRACLVANDVGGIGGMERQLSKLVEHLLEADWEVTVIARTMSVEAGTTEAEFQRVPGPKRPFVIAFPWFFVVASVMAARRRGEVLHSTGAIIGNRVDVSTVHYCHSSADARSLAARVSRQHWTYRLNAVLARALARYAEVWCYRPSRTALLCAVSQGLERELAVAFPRMTSRLRVIPNGVDVTKFKPDDDARWKVRRAAGIEDDQRVALFVGGDWDRKGLPQALEALALVRGWHLVIVGDGDEHRISAAAQALGLEGRIHYLGVVQEVERIFAAADAFVLPTAYETFSLVTYEAAACGLPLLVSPVSGVEDILEHGTNGWFIKRDARDIATRLEALGADANLLHSMGTAARRSALAFSWSAMRVGYEAVYAEAL
jgi:glycosyltransferase involved in cell wall biosynthesis